MTRFLNLFALCTAACIASPAQTFTTLANFDVTNCGNPGVPLVQGLDGNLYGTTSFGGASNNGAVFMLTLPSTLTTAFSFTVDDGSRPGGLVLVPDGSFYGAAGEGGDLSCDSFGCGTVFTFAPGGALSAVSLFSADNGGEPEGLVFAADGNLYGLNSGGAEGYGSVYKVTLSGALTTLYNFASSVGAYPKGPLVQGFDGNFYGTTNIGGSYGVGIVFQFAAGGVLTTLHTFQGADGAHPEAGLVQDAEGNLYGTTSSNLATGCLGGGCGTIFKITPNGTFTSLHTFDSTDGANPNSVLAAATDGNLYGTTTHGGAFMDCFSNGNYGCGTIFRITPSGQFTSIYNMDHTTGTSYGGLMQATDGNFYGTTVAGPSKAGTVFKFSAGLGPFVKTLPAAGAVGSTVHILGTNLTSPASVTFNGTPAVVTSVSPSQIIAAVPSGATTGKVVVTLPGGTLTSNTVFQVNE